MLYELAQQIPGWVLIAVGALSAFCLAGSLVTVLVGWRVAPRRDSERVSVPDEAPECWNRRCPVCDCQALNWRWLIWHIDQNHLEEALLAEDIGIAMLREAEAA
jgi:hypothetical protein